MKILISSKYFCSKLHEVDFDTTMIRTVHIKDKTLILLSEISCKTPKWIDYNIEHTYKSKIEISFMQNNNYRWLYEILNKIDDIPVVLEFNHNKLELIINF